MFRYRFTLEEKLGILAWIDEGHRVVDATSKFNVNKRTILRWRTKLEAIGPAALKSHPKNTKYSSQLKTEAVEAYLAGEGSIETLCLRFGIRNGCQLGNWILRYTQGEELKSSPGGKSRAMNRGRITTYEERLEIVCHCLEHDTNYQATAELYQVSYQQVYSWVRKYNEGGAESLLDGRGKAKKASSLTEVDRLKLEVRKLQKANYRLELENEFLKKLEELEKRSR